LVRAPAKITHNPKETKMNITENLESSRVVGLATLAFSFLLQLDNDGWRGCRRAIGGIFTCLRDEKACDG